MQSIDLIADNLNKSSTSTLAQIEDMADFCLVAPTAKDGAHTLWVLGHLAYIEALVIHHFMLGTSGVGDLSGAVRNDHRAAPDV